VKLENQIFDVQIIYRNVPIMCLTGSVADFSA